MKCSTLLFGGLIGWLFSDGAAALHKSKHKHGISRHPRFGRSKVDRIATLPSSSASQFHNVAGYESHRSIACRGGDCSDSNPALFAKIALGVAVETGLMYSLVNFAVNADKMKLYSTTTIRILQAFELLAIIFGSASFGAVVDTGLSAATKQLLDPNEIPGDGEWYNNLKKPSWNPPGWIFPIMWLIVSKPTQFIAVWKLVTQHSQEDLSIPLVVYCGHLALGDAWNKVFFGLECTGRGLAVISIFWSLLWLSAYLFYKVDQSAGLLLLPTCLWVTVAASLNLSIYLLNKDDDKCEE